MAVGRKVLHRMELVLRDDPALDPACLEMTEDNIYADPDEETGELSKCSRYDLYFAEGGNLAHLSFLPGEHPTIFVLEPMGRRQRMAIDSLSTWRDQELVMRCVLTEIRNYEIEDAEGNVEPLPDVERKKEGDRGRLVTQEWLDTANLPKVQIKAIAFAGYALSEGRLPLSKRSATPSGDGRSGGSEAANESAP